MTRIRFKGYVLSPDSPKWLAEAVRLPIDLPEAGHPCIDGRSRIKRRD